MGVVVFSAVCLCTWYISRNKSQNTSIKRGEFPFQQEARFTKAAMYEKESHVPEQFHKFVNAMIVPSFFRKQNSWGDQFAVLILVARVDIKDITRVVLCPRDHLGSPLVNSNYQRCPNSATDYNNYIVARPEYNSHAEKALLDELDPLWSAFVASNGRPPKHIVLYSWMIPCTECTELIINILCCKRYKSVGKIVAYRRKIWSELSAEENNVNRQLLRNAGIKTVEVVP